jgi:hypothetical protein
LNLSGSHTNIRRSRYIIGDFSNLLSNISKDRDEFDGKMRSMNDLLAYVDAPQDVRDKVQNYYYFKFHNKEGSSQMVDELPSALQTQLTKHRYGSLLGRVPFFSGLRGSALVGLCEQMNSVTVTPGDPIMKIGQRMDELLILSKGLARTATKSGRGGQYTVYPVGSFWGEEQFLGIEQQRSLTVLGPFVAARKLEHTPSFKLAILCFLPRHPCHMAKATM